MAWLGSHVSHRGMEPQNGHLLPGPQAKCKSHYFPHSGPHKHILPLLGVDMGTGSLSTPTPSSASLTPLSSPGAEGGAQVGSWHFNVTALLSLILNCVI